MKKYQLYGKWVTIFVLGVLLIVVYKTFDNFQNIMNFIGKIFSALTPFVIGFIIAYILNFPSKKLEELYGKAKWKFISKRKKGLGIASVYVIFVLLIYGAMSVVIPKLYTNIVDFSNNIIPIIQNGLERLEEFQENTGFTIIEINEVTTKNILQGFVSSINLDGVGKYAQGAIDFTSGVINVLIALIVSVYMLIDKERLIRRIEQIASILISERKRNKIRKYLSRANDIFASYIYSSVLDALIVSVLATVILSIVGVKYAIIFGTFIGICNLIPYFGAIISNCVTVIITLLTGEWVKAIWVAIGLFVLGQLDGNFIGPKIMGNKLEVRPILIIFAVTLGGGLFGVLGMILSVPIMMIIKMIAEELLDNIKEKKLTENKNQE